MPEPTSMEEYQQLYLENTRTSGSGILGLTQHFACPICAAPEWLVVKVIDFQQDHISTCEACHRTVQLQFERTESGMGMQAVMTDGPEPPEWLQPPIPRGPAR